eukprot:UN05484
MIIAHIDEHNPHSHDLVVVVVVGGEVEYVVLVVVDVDYVGVFVVDGVVDGVVEGIYHHIDYIVVVGGCLVDGIGVEAV